MTERFRLPKRKAAEAATKSDKPPESLLEEVLRPLNDTERADWPGWLELESEPSFFNVMLQDLGIKGLRAQELIALDDWSLDLLPKPIFGLIFLFQYIPEDDTDSTGDPVPEIWFANQTTANSCASVALLNIVMNQDVLELGDELEKFKASTMDLSPPMRGYELGKNRFLRAIHNRFARRVDHLVSDVDLEMDAAKLQNKKTRKKTSFTRTKRKKKRTNSNDEPAFHFVAYIPFGGAVYELDGLNGLPTKLDSFSKEHEWTTAAVPHIQARMLQHEASLLSFNLLALCHSPSLQQLSKSVSDTLTSLKFLQNKGFADQNSHFIDSIIGLEQLGLTSDCLEKGVVDINLQQFNFDECTSDVYIQELRSKYAEKAKAVAAQYQRELEQCVQDRDCVEAREKDYGLAIHTWLLKLAEKGILEDLIKVTP